MQLVTYVDPTAIYSRVHPKNITDKDAQVYLSQLFTRHWVKTDGRQSIKNFSEPADDCLKKVTKRRKSMRTTLILLAVAFLFGLWSFKSDDFTTSMVMFSLTCIPGLIGVLRFYHFFRDEKPGKVVYEIASAWKEALVKLNEVDVLRAFGNRLRGASINRAAIHTLRDETTTLAGWAFDAQLDHFADKFRQAETQDHRRDKARARDMFAKTDKASQLLGFKGADWNMLNEK